MAQQSVPQSLEKTIVSICDLIIREVNLVLGYGTWKCAYIDERGGAKSSTRISKLRMLSPDNEEINSQDERIDDALLATSKMFTEIWKIKDGLFSEKWYGMKLTIYPDGKHEVQFNYDAKCVMDPTFFQS